MENLILGSTISPSSVYAVCAGDPVCIADRISYLFVYLQQKFLTSQGRTGELIFISRGLVKYWTTWIHFPEHSLILQQIKVCWWLRCWWSYWVNGRWLKMGLGKGKTFQWDWGREDGRMGKRVGIGMESEYCRNFSQRSKMNKRENYQKLYDVVEFSYCFYKFPHYVRSGPFYLRTKVTGPIILYWCVYFLQSMYIIIRSVLFSYQKSKL